jgi:hypothetical protein
MENGREPPHNLWHDMAGVLSMPATESVAGAMPLAPI